MVSYYEANGQQVIAVYVLILVVVEDGLVPSNEVSLSLLGLGLNPYCSGRWSRTLLMGATIDVELS